MARLRIPEFPAKVRARAPCIRGLLLESGEKSGRRTRAASVLYGRSGGIVLHGREGNAVLEGEDGCLEVFCLDGRR